MNKILYALLFALVGLWGLTTAESGLRLLSRTNPRATPAELVDYEAEDRRKLVGTVNLDHQNRALKSEKSGGKKTGGVKKSGGKSGSKSGGKSGSKSGVKTHGGKKIHRKSTKKEKNKKNSCDVRSKKEKEAKSEKSKDKKLSNKSKDGSKKAKDGSSKDGSKKAKDGSSKDGSKKAKEGSSKDGSKKASKNGGKPTGVKKSDKKAGKKRMRFLESKSGGKSGSKSGGKIGGKSGSKSGKKTCGEKSKKLEKKKKDKKGKKDKKKRDKKQVDKERIPGQCVANHVCAELTGDPHITTFDGTKYDCQGHGEFVLMKSMTSPFEVQGRFHKVNPTGPSITQGISIDEGVEGSPQLDVFAELADGECFLSIYVNGELTSDFGEDGLKYPGLEYQPDVDVGADYLDYFLFSGSGIMFTTSVRKGSLGCVLNSKFCIPPAMANSEPIVGLLGSVYGPAWMTPNGGAVDMSNKGSYEASFKYCTDNWCVDNAADSIFGYLPGTDHAMFNGCNNAYNDAAEKLVMRPSEACVECCAPVIENDLAYKRCKLDCEVGETIDCEIEMFAEAVLATAQNKCLEPIPDDPECKVDTDCAVGKNCIRGFCLVPPPEEVIEEEEEEEVPPPDDRSGPEDDVDPDDPTTEKAFTKGDPHFKTFGGELYDFHGECDLILVDNPEFKGVGMQIQIRTKITDWWSSVEAAAVKIGDEVLEIQANLDSTEWMWINGQANDVLEDGKWYHARLAGFLVRFKQTITRAGEMREANIYFEGADKAGAKDPLVLKTFKSFVHLDINWKGSENFNTATGLLGSMAHEGARLGRDGELIEDINTFGQDWQVRASDAQLFHSYEGVVVAPNMCRLPEESLAKQALRNRRLAEGMPYEEAEAACNHLQSAEEKDACIYDVLATQDKDMAGAW